MTETINIVILVILIIIVVAWYYRTRESDKTKVTVKPVPPMPSVAETVEPYAPIFGGLSYYYPYTLRSTGWPEWIPQTFIGEMPNDIGYWSNGVNANDAFYSDRARRAGGRVRAL